MPDPGASIAKHHKTCTTMKQIIAPCSSKQRYLTKNQMVSALPDTRLFYINANVSASEMVMRHDFLILVSENSKKESTVMVRAAKYAHPDGAIGSCLIAFCRLENNEGCLILWLLFAVADEQCFLTNNHAKGDIYEYETERRNHPEFTGWFRLGGTDCARTVHMPR
jgi:hypothetical protein